MKGETYHKSNCGVLKGIFKKGKVATSIASEILPTGTQILKAEKLKDVADLLRKHYGEDWMNEERLSFYTDLLKSQELLNVRGYNIEILPADDVFYENVEEGSDLQI